MPTAKESAASPEVPDVVYDWFVHELEFPFGMYTRDKPEWMDLRKLAEACQRDDGMQEELDDYLYMICDQTGWDYPE